MGVRLLSLLASAALAAAQDITWQTHAGDNRRAAVSTVPPSPGPGETPEPSIEPRIPTALLSQKLASPSICVAPGGKYYMTGEDGSSAIRLWTLGANNRWQPLVDAVIRASQVVRSPRVHYIGGTFWITYGVDGWGAGLLRSRTGDARGPYDDYGRLSEGFPEASLFTDTDGQVYWLTGDARLARMTPGPRTLAEPLRPLATRPFAAPAGNREFEAEPAKQGSVGISGAHLVKFGERYYLFQADWIHRLGSRTFDTFVATAETIAGPYSARYVIVPHGGETTVFPDTGGRAWATFSARDEWGVLEGRPGAVPLRLDADGFLHVAHGTITERGPVARLRPVLDQPVRDAFIAPGTDRDYVLTGTTGAWRAVADGIEMWRSRDLAAWQSLGMVWQFDRDATWQKEPREIRGAKRRAAWTPELHFLKGAWWLPYSVSGGDTAILRSRTGKPEGPFQDLGALTGSGPDGSLFQDEDGKVYYVGQGGMIARFHEDMTRLAEKPRQLLAAGEKIGNAGAFVVRIDGRYVLAASEWHGDKGVDGTHDLMYAVSSKLEGPYSKRRVAVPHGGGGTFFRDHSGRWWCSFSGSDRTAPFRERPGLAPLSVRREGEDLVVEPAP